MQSENSLQNLQDLRQTLINDCSTEKEKIINECSKDDDFNKAIQTIDNQNVELLTMTEVIEKLNTKVLE